MNIVRSYNETISLANSMMAKIGRPMNHETSTGRVGPLHKWEPKRYCARWWPD
jgi:hypothetical protein